MTLLSYYVRTHRHDLNFTKHEDAQMKHSFYITRGHKKLALRVPSVQRPGALLYASNLIMYT